MFKREDEMKFSNQEFALLQATRYSEHAQSASQLAQNAEATDVQDTLDCLVKKDILQSFEGYTTTDGKLETVYGYADNDLAQQIYCEIHDVPPLPRR